MPCTGVSDVVPGNACLAQTGQVLHFLSASWCLRLHAQVRAKFARSLKSASPQREARAEGSGVGCFVAAAAVAQLVAHHQSSYQCHALVAQPGRAAFGPKRTDAATEPAGLGIGRERVLVCEQPIPVEAYIVIGE